MNFQKGSLFSNYEDLESFIYIYQLGTLLKASKHLNHNPSVISKRLERLENFLHKPLFYKSSKGYKATEFGEYYYNNYALNIHQHVLEQSKKFYHIQQGSQQTIHMSIPLLFMSLGYGDFILSFIQKHKNYSINLDISNDTKDMSNYQFDFVVLVYSEIPKDSSLIIRKLFLFNRLFVLRQIF